MLSYPSIAQILEETDFELLLAGKDSLGNKVSKTIVGAMEPHDAIPYIVDDSLLITPGDREDMILAVVGFQMDRKAAGVKIAGIVLSGGIKPHKTVIDLVQRAEIPLLLAKGDTYSVASRVHDLTVKIQPEDSQKTKVIRDMIEEYVDIGKLLREL